MKSNLKFSMIFKENLTDIIKLILSSTIFFIALIIRDTNLTILLFIISAIICGYEIIFEGIRKIFKFDLFDENFLMTVASVVAFILGEYREGTLIIILFSLGELFENIATENSKNKIKGLNKLKCNKANLVNGDKSIKETDLENLKVGSIILVKYGESVPVDGVLLEDAGQFDLKIITGESKIYDKKKGEEILSGSINIGVPVLIKTTKLFQDSMVEKIIKTVENSTENKAKSQKFITGFSKFYTPIIIFLAVIIAVIPPIFNSEWKKYIYKALSFVVISCPCALVISIPLGFFVGIGSLAKRGILVKGSKYIDCVSKANCIVFDKTGTLTEGILKVEKIEMADKDDDNIIDYICSIESLSNHVLAKSILEYCPNFNMKKVENFEEILGKGVSGKLDGKNIIIGSYNLMKEHAIMCDKIEYDGVVLYVSLDEKLSAYIFLEDHIKTDAVNTIETLKKLKFGNIVLMSGDDKDNCEKIKEQLGLNDFYYNMLPDDKTNKLKEIMSSESVIYVGDGINDSPSLSIADVGISMGSMGSEIAINCSDIVIMEDKLSKLHFLVKKCRKIKRKIVENIVVSIGVKIGIMAVSLFAGIPVWLSMFGDVGVMLIAVINSLTLSK